MILQVFQLEKSFHLFSHYDISKVLKGQSLVKVGHRSSEVVHNRIQLWFSVALSRSPRDKSIIAKWKYCNHVSYSCQIDKRRIRNVLSRHHLFWFLFKSRHMFHATLVTPSVYINEDDVGQLPSFKRPCTRILKVWSFWWHLIDRDQSKSNRNFEFQKKERITSVTLQVL